jgi:hypothetical protein
MNTPTSSEVDRRALQQLINRTNPLHRVVWDDNLTSVIGSFYNPPVASSFPRVNLEAQFKKAKKIDEIKKIKNEMKSLYKSFYRKKTGESDVEFNKRIERERKSAIKRL